VAAIMRTFLTYSDARRSGTAWRQAIRVFNVNEQFVFTHYFSEFASSFQKMNSDGIVFWKKECGIQLLFFELKI
jgi:hypothetical protein